MSTPAAILKAESLRKFALGQGSPLADFQLLVSESEAFELLDYLADPSATRCEADELLLLDIAEAKLKRDPWPVLEHFRVLGLEIKPVRALH